MNEFFVKLGYLAIPLATCSIITTAIVCERIMFFAMLKKHNKEFENTLKSSLNNKNLSKQEAEEKISLLLFVINLKQTKFLQSLSLIAVISPMLGLLGTILGIIEAFKSIAGSTNAISPALLASGLWQAILTTAVGISIAIFATISHFIFKILANKMANNQYIKANSFLEGKF